MSKDIKKVMRKLEYGVYVVTLGKGSQGNAFTASWLTQVSSEPPMIAIAINNKHQSARLLKDLDGFVVHLLGEGQEAFAKTFYGPAESGYEKLAATGVEDSPITASPLLKGAAGYMDCKIIERVLAGNHTLFVAEVVAANLADDCKILATSNSNLHYTG
jgi:flavin reductase (DIM6/NTAB) family NADH-FMN oxidoreductase RutF